MTIMWSAVSFTTYLLHFQLKYLQGNIFVNSNYCALADSIAVIAGGLIFAKLGLKNTYYVAFSFGLIGGLGILQTEITKLQMNTDGMSQAEIFDKQLQLSSRIPICVFIAKFGIEIGFLSSYFASFTDDRIFPIEKRATAIGLCKVVARGLTGTAPMINELPDPVPMVCFSVALATAFAYNITLNLPKKEGNKGESSKALSKRE